MSKTKFFKTEVQAQLILDGLEPFEPSRFCTQKEIDNGGGKPRVLEFANGFAIQLGYYGNYYPNTKNNLYNSD